MRIFIPKSTEFGMSLRPLKNRRLNGSALCGDNVCWNQDYQTWPQYSPNNYYDPFDKRRNWKLEIGNKNNR